MSQKPKNGNILSFFKPVTRSQTPPATLSQEPRSSKTRSLSPLPPSSPLSHKSTPVKSKTPVKRDVEIKDSDDEDGFSSSSEGSLEDLSTILGRHRPPLRVPSPHPPQNPLVTPRAKRTAVEFHSSPLAIIPKHKFDLKLLAKDAKKDTATHASSTRVQTTVKPENDEEEDDTSKSPQDTLENIVKDKDGQDAQKVMRAVQRTKGRQPSLQYRFFRIDYTPPKSTPFPKEFSKTPLKILKQKDHFLQGQRATAGSAIMVFKKYRGKPVDSLFNWVLDELCIERSEIVRREYRLLLNTRPRDIARIMVPGRLEKLFLRLGAADHLTIQDSVLPVSKTHEPYAIRDWANLMSVVRMLGAMSPHLSISSLNYLIPTLLRMALDRIISHNIDLLNEFERAIGALLDAVPRSIWDEFCFDTCTLLHNITRAQSIRMHALASLPTRSDPGHDLRRRLAVAFLFDDPSLGRYNPDNVVTIRGIIDCVGRGGFAVGPQTEFPELRASIQLLNICVDDGGFFGIHDAEDEKKFNAEIDELALRLRGVWRNINDSGMKLARTEAKNALEWVQNRLEHSVRTRSKETKSIFDFHRRKEDPFLPRQQEYMKNFLRKPQGFRQSLSPSSSPEPSDALEHPNPSGLQVPAKTPNSRTSPTPIKSPASSDSQEFHEARESQDSPPSQDSSPSVGADTIVCKGE